MEEPCDDMELELADSCIQTEVPTSEEFGRGSVTKEQSLECLETSDKLKVLMSALQEELNTSSSAMAASMHQLSNEACNSLPTLEFVTPKEEGQMLELIDKLKVLESFMNQQMASLVENTAKVAYLGDASKRENPTIGSKRCHPDDA